MSRLSSLPRPGKTTLLLGGAILFGLLATFATRSYIQQTVDAEKAKLKKETAKVEVVVAKFNLNKGDIVSEDSMSLRPIPADTAPSSAVTAEQFERAAGGRLLGSMRAGEPLLWPLIEADNAANFAHRVKNGERAFTITVDEVNSISDMVRPGDLVDVYWSAKPAQIAGNALPNDEQTLLLMQNLLVMATGQKVKNAQNVDGENPELAGFGTVTLALRPLDAQKLIVAQRNGQIRITLRNPEDQQSTAAPRMSMVNLFGGSGSRNAGPSGMAEVIVGGRGLSREWQALSQAARLVASRDKPPMPKLDGLPGEIANPAAAAALAGMGAAPGMPSK